MAERKTKTTKTSSKKMSDVVVNNDEPKTMATILEEETVKKVEELTAEARQNIVEVKEMEAELLEKLEVEPENANTILTTEIEEIGEKIQEVETQIEQLTETLKNNKVFATTTSWNGWGYEM